MSLLFNMLSRWVIAFLLRSKCLTFMAAVIICSDFRAQENKVCHCFHCFPIYLPWSYGTRSHDLSFLNVEFEASFLLSSFTFIKRLFSSSSLSAIFSLYFCPHFCYFLPSNNFGLWSSFSSYFRCKFRLFVRFFLFLELGLYCYELPS